MLWCPEPSLCSRHPEPILLKALCRAGASLWAGSFWSLLLGAIPDFCTSRILTYPDSYHFPHVSQSLTRVLICVCNARLISWFVLPSGGERGGDAVGPQPLPRGLVSWRSVLGILSHAGSRPLLARNLPSLQEHHLRVFSGSGSQASSPTMHLWVHTRIRALWAQAGVHTASPGPPALCPYPSTRIPSWSLCAPRLNPGPRCLLSCAMFLPAAQRADVGGELTGTSINHSQLLLQRLQELLRQGNASDVVLRVQAAGTDEVRVFHVHRLLLGLHSELFRELLSNQSEAVLQEPRDCAAVFDKFIRCGSTGRGGDFIPFQGPVFSAPRVAEALAPWRTRCPPIPWRSSGWQCNRRLQPFSLCPLAKCSVTVCPCLQALCGLMSITNAGRVVSKPGLGSF